MRSEIRLNRVFLLMILAYQCETLGRPNVATMFFFGAVIELGLAAFTGITEVS